MDAIILALVTFAFSQSLNLVTHFVSEYTHRSW